MGWASPVLSSAAPSPQKETQPVCALACPAQAHPCLPRSVTSGTLRTLGTSHPSACLQVRLTQLYPQAGKSLLGPRFSSHRPLSAWAKGRAAPRVSHRPAYWHTLTLAQPRPQLSGGYRVCLLGRWVSRSHPAPPMPLGQAFLALGEPGGKEGHTDSFQAPGTSTKGK